MMEQEIRNKRIYGSVMILFFAILTVLFYQMQIITLGFLAVSLAVLVGIGFVWFQVFKMRK
jgi:hypothetical protein